MNRRSFGSLLAGIALVPAPTLVSAQSGVPPEFGAPGVQTDGHWISPQFGVEVTWELPYELDYTPGASVFTNEVGDQFNIALPDTYGLFNVSISGPANTAYAPFTDAERFLKDFEKRNAPVHLLFDSTEEWAAALIVMEWGMNLSTSKDIPNQVLLFQIYPSRDNPEVVIQTRIDARYKDIHEYARALDKHVTVDGGPALRAFDLEEVLDALENLPPDGAH